MLIALEDIKHFTFQSGNILPFFLSAKVESFAPLHSNLVIFYRINNSSVIKKSSFTFQSGNILPYDELGLKLKC